MPNRRRFCCTAQHSTAQYSPDPEKARVYTVVKFLENEEQVWAPNTLGRGIPGWGLAWWSPNLMRQGGPGLRLAWEVGPGRWEIARRHSNPLRAETFFVPLSSVRVFEVVVKRSSRQGPATELSNEPGMMGFENWNWARQDWEQPFGKHHAVGVCQLAWPQDLAPNCRDTASWRRWDVREGVLLCTQQPGHQHRPSREIRTENATHKLTLTEARFRLTTWSSNSESIPPRPSLPHLAPLGFTTEWPALQPSPTSSPFPVSPHMSHH